MNVFCYPATRDSAYVPLLFGGIEDRYRPIYREEGTVRRAIAELAAGRSAIVHVHWEEFVLDGCTTSLDADRAARDFIDALDLFAARGGVLFWTVHNEIPHTSPFRMQFLAMRDRLAALADVVLVHNHASVAVLARQCGIDPSRIRILPHPSYLDRFEDQATLETQLATPRDGARRIQCFGWIRLQKGYAGMLDMLPPGFLRARGMQVRISGHGEEADAVIAQRPDRSDVHWDVRHIPDAETPALLRSATCVVLPYDRVLTSGVMLLALSVGAMIVAVDIPQMRALLPAMSCRFLYPRGDGPALRRVIDDVLSLSAAERLAIIHANLAVARDLHPHVIAARMAALYDVALHRE